MLPILSRQRMNLGISPGICTGILCLTCISGIYFGEKKSFFWLIIYPGIIYLIYDAFLSEYQVVKKKEKRANWRFVTKPVQQKTF